MYGVVDGVNFESDSSDEPTANACIGRWNMPDATPCDE